MQCVLALVDQPRDEHVERQLERIHASGAHVYLTQDEGADRRDAPVARAAPRPRVRPAERRLVARWARAGSWRRRSSWARRCGRGELPEPETVWCALGSGGTAAGLAVGLRMAGLGTKVCAVHVNDQLRLSEATILRLARRTGLADGGRQRRRGRPRLPRRRATATGREAARAAIERAREAEGLDARPRLHRQDDGRGPRPPRAPAGRADALLAHLQRRRVRAKRRERALAALGASGSSAPSPARRTARARRGRSGRSTWTGTACGAARARRRGGPARRSRGRSARARPSRATATPRRAASRSGPRRGGAGRRPR